MYDIYFHFKETVFSRFFEIRYKHIVKGKIYNLHIKQIKTYVKKYIFSVLFIKSFLWQAFNIFRQKSLIFEFCIFEFILKKV